MAAGLHWFLKYACRSAVSWAATGGRSLDHGCLAPQALRALEQQGAMHRERSVPWHYYQNVVTPRSAPRDARGFMSQLAPLVPVGLSVVIPVP